MTLEQGEDGDHELVNEVFRILEEPQRRRILFSLLEHNPQDSLLVPEDVHGGDTELEILNIALVHNHLPMLEEAGLIRWDREAQEVHKGPQFAKIRNLLESIKVHYSIITEE